MDIGKQEVIRVGKCNAVSLQMCYGQCGSGERQTQPMNDQDTMLQLKCLTNCSTASVDTSMEHITLCSVESRRNTSLAWETMLDERKNNTWDPPREKRTPPPHPLIPPSICSLTTMTKWISLWWRLPLKQLITVLSLTPKDKWVELLWSGFPLFHQTTINVSHQKF